jgi:hypothetical protein
MKKVKVMKTRRLPKRENPLPLLLAPLAPYAVAGATIALKATAVAIVGGTLGTVAYSKYVASEEEQRRKDLPKIADDLEQNIRRVSQNMDVPWSMPSSLWIAPTDDAQASLRVAWLYMLAAIKNPQHKIELLDDASYELAEYRRLENGEGASYPANAPELQFSYKIMMNKLNQLGIAHTLVPFITAVKETQDPDKIAEQRLFESNLKDEASIETALLETAKDAKKAADQAVKGGECTKDLLLGLVTGKKPESCDITRMQWIRIKGIVYGTVGLYAAVKILPPFFKFATPLVKKWTEE